MVGDMAYRANAGVVIGNGAIPKGSTTAHAKSPATQVITPEQRFLTAQCTDEENCGLLTMFNIASIKLELIGGRSPMMINALFSTKKPDAADPNVRMGQPFWMRSPPQPPGSDRTCS
jgi:hypothetical protein